MLDIAVCINIWIRPELQRKQFCIIKQVKPTVLFLISDGGRTNLENDVILKNRAYVESQIDWDCIVYKLYENYNNGLYCMIEKNKYPYKENYIIVYGDSDIVADGMHRCVCLYSINGDMSIPIKRYYFGGENSKPIKTWYSKILYPQKITKKLYKKTYRKMRKIYHTIKNKTYLAPIYKMFYGTKMEKIKCTIMGIE